MTKRPKILLINGPNLNLLGRREPEIYRTITLLQIEDLIRQDADEAGFDVVCLQSNYEGDLVTYIQEAPDEGIIAIMLNAGGYTHTSVALRDAVEFAKSQGVPTAEIHLSDTKKREEFRHFSYLEDVCVGTFAGKGLQSYVEALSFLRSLVTKQPKKPKGKK
jgi:3-dehydroquinate dehydratase-2